MKLENNDKIRSSDLPKSRGSTVRLHSLLANDVNKARRKKQISDPESLIVLDLFAGAGGMSFGFEREGFVVGAGLDHNAFACETFSANHLAPGMQIDLSTREECFQPRELIASLGLPKVDVIVGGPPCQGFSQIGIAKVRSLSAEVRERILAQNQLYREFVRFVAELNPLMFVMENVPHMGKFKDGLIAQQIRTDFESLGYELSQPMILDASHYGVPQSRKRLFFIGSKIGNLFSNPPRTHGDHLRVRTLADAIADLPKVTAPAREEDIEYWPSDPKELEVQGVWNSEYSVLMRNSMPTGTASRLYDHIVRAVRDDDAVVFRSMRQGGTYEEVDEKYRRYEIKRDRTGAAHFGDRYFRLPWHKPSITITAHLAKDGYRYIYPDNDQIRTISIREAARIQSFPDSFRFAGSQTSRFVQIGNAVPPLLAQAIAREIKHSILAWRSGVETARGSYGSGQLLLSSAYGV